MKPIGLSILETGKALGGEDDPPLARDDLPDDSAARA